MHVCWDVCKCCKCNKQQRVKKSSAGRFIIWDPKAQLAPDLKHFREGLKQWAGFITPLPKKKGPTGTPTKSNSAAHFKFTHYLIDSAHVWDV